VITRYEAVVSAKGRLDSVVAASIPDLSRSRAAGLVKQGAVCVDGLVVTRVSVEVRVGSQLVVDVPDAVADKAVAQDLPLDIVYQDDDMAVINKAAGMVVHPAAGHPDGTLVNALLHHLEGLSGIGGVARPGIVHRLDRGTSGLLVVAKHDVAHHGLAAQFSDHSANRRYWALCHGVPKVSSGTVRTHVARHPRDRVRWASTDGRSGKLAVTHWERLDVAGVICLIGCRLETGRTHQVRIHMTESNWPLLGDPVYKRKGRRLPVTVRELVQPNRPLLHAWRLALTHPISGEPLVFTVEPPADYQATLDALGIERRVEPNE
jgi:23S rRNA pseudouridine1911/1915/1917 synthase